MILFRLLRKKTVDFQKVKRAGDLERQVEEIHLESDGNYKEE